MTKFFGIFFQKKCIFMKKGYLSAAFLLLYPLNSGSVRSPLRKLS